MEAQATDFDTAANQRWHGYSDRLTESGIDVLLWKEAEAGGAIDCDLFPLLPGENYPGPYGGQAMGYSPDAGIALAAGGNNLATAGESFVFDTNTGQRIEVIPSFAFDGARAYATVTPFGTGLLLAGGEFPDDLVPVSAREALRTAAVYDPSLQGFDGELQLDLRRTRHAAVVLEGGETLLVGGGQPTTEGETVPVTKFEIVSPSTRSSTISGVDGLIYGRLEPSAIRLDDGRILVGGGYATTGAPVDPMEWFSPDASIHVSPSDTPCGVTPDPTCTLEPRHHRSFVALPGGGALTVGGCAPGEQDATCEEVCGTGFGCPAPEPSATCIAPNGELTTVGFEQPTSFCAGTIPFSPEHVMLAPGSDGSPWLFASDEDRDPVCRAVFRFQPWSNVRPCPSADETGVPNRCPVFAPVELGVTDWPDMRTRLASLGPDAFMWVGQGDSPSFVGARTGVRGALSQNETLLVTDSSAPEVPLHLAPDRWPNVAPRALFETEEGGHLLLAPSMDGVPAVSVYVTDALYDDVTVTLGFRGNGPPLVLLGSFEVGSESCPWPENPQTPLVVTRRGPTVTLTDWTGNDARCETAPNGSVSLGFRAGLRNTTITSLGVKRD